VDLRHAPGSPPYRADLHWISLGEVTRDQIRGTRVAFPEILVRRGEPRHDRARLLRLCRIGHVPDLVARVGDCVAERPQEICLALPLADARHLGAALLGAAGSARDVSQIAWPRRVGDVDDRGAVVFLYSGQRIARLAAVMADVGDEVAASLVERRLVRRAYLQMVVA